MRGQTLSRQAKERQAGPSLDFLQQKSRVWMMGILNATPDSFYSHSRTLQPDDALAHAQRMLDEGANLLDIGGESTRPGAPAVSDQTELARVLPLIDALHERWPQVPLSVDTQKAAVAREALAHGASLINDISALRHDPAMAEIVAESGAPVVLMHMQGTPETMQRDPRYRDVVVDVKAFFEERMTAAIRAGISEQRLILDPGIGFGKSLEHNVLLLKHLATFSTLGRPLLIGVSRKSFVAKLSESSSKALPPPEERWGGTLAATLWALEQGANGVRTHDVGATRQAISVWRALAER